MRINSLVWIFLLYSITFAQIPDISFNTGKWTFYTGAGFAYDKSKEEITMKGSPSNFIFVRFEHTFSSKPKNLYFSADVFFNNYKNGTLVTTELN